jgi:hypothetical protein
MAMTKEEAREKLLNHPRMARAKDIKAKALLARIAPDHATNLARYSQLSEEAQEAAAAAAAQLNKTP